MSAVYFCAMTVALSFLGALELPAVSPAQPNIVMFLIDDLGWNDTGFQGAEYSTPTIDKLASEGIRLKQYYVQPVCSPSRSALMAGRYSYNLGLADGVITNGHPYGLDLGEITIAQHLKDGGYATHAIGKKTDFTFVLFPAVALYLFHIVGRAALGFLSLSLSPNRCVPILIAAVFPLL